MSFEQRAKILEIAQSSQCSVTEIVHVLKLKTSNGISLLRKMGDEHLIELRRAEDSKKGRPKQYVTVTPLGCQFLEAYKKLDLTRLKARKQDLDHAAKDAMYANKLVQDGHSAFEVFMELNGIVSYIARSSETH
jgi:predicted transcriptional regulator